MSQVGFSPQQLEWFARSFWVRYVVSQQIAERQPSWQAVMSRKGYSLLVDALSAELVNAGEFSWRQALDWVEAIDYYLKNQ
jgi:hypothetical protein